MVVKTAFYVSRGTFWWRRFFWKSYLSLKIFGRRAKSIYCWWKRKVHNHCRISRGKIFWLVATYGRRVANCILLVQKHCLTKTVLCTFYVFCSLPKIEFQSKICGTVVKTGFYVFEGDFLSKIWFMKNWTYIRLFGLRTKFFRVCWNLPAALSTKENFEGKFTLSKMFFFCCLWAKFSTFGKTIPQVCHKQSYVSRKHFEKKTFPKNIKFKIIVGFSERDFLTLVFWPKRVDGVVKNALQKSNRSFSIYFEESIIVDNFLGVEQKTFLNLGVKFLAVLSEANSISSVQNFFRKKGYF